MQKLFSFVFPLIFVSLLIAGCGDEAPSSQVEVQSAKLEIFDSIKDLPDCETSNDGKQVYVKDTAATLVCTDSQWRVTISFALEDGSVSCKTESLGDSSGIKVICNGDSVGIVLNGANGHPGKNGENGGNGDDGKNGEDGVSGINCGIGRVDDETVSINCGTDTLIYKVGDSIPEYVVNQLNGFSQKGPFVKGTKVFAYELNNGSTLEQTSRSFVGTIQGDDGKFSISSVSLTSPYVLLEAYGFYRNEVTGLESKSPISLYALTDVMDREKANVNLLTHMEYYRVRHLVLNEKMSFDKARIQAERELFKTFNIEDNSGFGNTEDLDIFSEGEGNAALLAISIMLQRDSSESVLSKLLSDISSDLAENGAWTDSVTRAEVANWAMQLDSACGTGSWWDIRCVDYEDDVRRMVQIRKKVEDWKLGDVVPNFEKYIRQFWGIELGMGVCGSDSVPAGTVKHVSNPYAKDLYAKSYSDASNTVIRFICMDDGMWKSATTMERDTVGWEAAPEGTTRRGQVYEDTIYVYEHGWRMGIAEDLIYYNLGYEPCMFSNKGHRIDVDGIRHFCFINSYNEGSVVRNQFLWLDNYTGSSVSKYYTFNLEIQYDTLIDRRDGQAYRTVQIGNQVWMAENLALKYKDDVATSYGYQAENNGYLYNWKAAMDQPGRYKETDDCEEDDDCPAKINVRGICPEGWHLPSKDEWNELYETVKATNENVHSALQSQLGWNLESTDDFGFSARLYDCDKGDVLTNSPACGSYNRTFFWSSTKKGQDAQGNNLVYAWSIMMDNVELLTLDERYGLSVRCVKD